MRKCFAIRKLFHLMCVGGMVSLSGSAFASGFQLFEQDGATVGNYHAGRSAEARDASTAFYNPAGIMRIHNQEIVVGDVGILSDIQYKGTVAPGVRLPSGFTIPLGAPQNVVAQGGVFSQVPNFYYVAPITQKLGFGLSLNAPFGLRTNYGTNTALRYVATKSQLEVADLSPNLAYSINNKISVGAGIDFQRMTAELDQVGVAGVGSTTDSYSTTKGWGTAQGFHVGALYEFNPDARVGLAFNSQVVHHIRGNSNLSGPIANVATGVPLGQPASIYSSNANAHVTLPAYTTLSGFYKVNEKWDVMGTTMYTRWSVIQNIILQDVSSAMVGPGFSLIPNTATTVTLPTNYRNTWNFSAGANYHANEKIFLRTGLGFDQSPIRNQYRDVRIPDNNRVAVALGGHYQATKTLGLDMGWTHLFLVGNANVSPPPIVTGSQTVTTVGNVKASADVFGAQLKWDIV